jgi:hypothetical protein
VVSSGEARRTPGSRHSQHGAATGAVEPEKSVREREECAARSALCFDWSETVVRRRRTREILCASGTSGSGK